MSIHCFTFSDLFQLNHNPIFYLNHPFLNCSLSYNFINQTFNYLIYYHYIFPVGYSLLCYLSSRLKSLACQSLNVIQLIYSLSILIVSHLPSNQFFLNFYYLKNHLLLFCRLKITLYGSFNLQLYFFNIQDYLC